MLYGGYKPHRIAIIVEPQIVTEHYILYGGYKPQRIAVIIEPQIVTEHYILYGDYKPQKIYKGGTPMQFLLKKIALLTFETWPTRGCLLFCPSICP